MLLDGVTSFSGIKTHEMHVNAPITVKIFVGISFHVMAENWQHLKVQFLLCVRVGIDSCLQVICCPIYSHETPDVAFRSATPTSAGNCLPKKDVKYSPMGNTAVLSRYLKHKPVMLLKRYI